MISSDSENYSINSAFHILTKITDDYESTIEGSKTELSSLYEEEGILKEDVHDIKILLKNEVDEMDKDYEPLIMELGLKVLRLDVINREIETVRDRLKCYIDVHTRNYENICKLRDDLEAGAHLPLTHEDN